MEKDGIEYEGHSFLNLSEQTLSKIGNCDYSNIARGSNNYLRIVLKTDIQWNNMAKVVTVRTLGGVEYNTIYEPTGVLLPEEVTKNSYFEVLVIYGKSEQAQYKGTNLAVNHLAKAFVTVHGVTFTVNEGTTLLDYEPYTGGKPSPSPEYPQEIKAVVNPVIKTHGTNLLDIKDVAETMEQNKGRTCYFV